MMNLIKFKSLVKPCLIAISAFSLLASGAVNAAGLLKPNNSSLPDLEIRQHHVDVVIENGYATTQIDQVFHNPNSMELEAIYSFPIPEKATVGEFTYWIDGKPVNGEVVEKQRAREIYQQEKKAGRETALVEKDQYKTFDISVYPVRANSDVRIRLVYLQATDIDHGIGRYVYPLEEGGVDEEKLSFWTRNEVVKEQFSFNLRMRSGYPLDDIRLPQHPNAVIQTNSPQEWSVTLGNTPAAIEEGTTTHSNQVRLDQDIIAYWRLQEGLPGAVDMVTYRDQNSTQGTFMLTLTPGDDLSPTQAGRDWLFVLDISGSMQGKYATLVDGVRQGLGKLQAQDRFRVILFNKSAIDISSGYLPVNNENIQRILHSLDQTRPNGGTNLYEGLESAIKNLDADRPSAILLVTDGVANVGKTEKRQFLKLLKKNDVRLFTFIMGNSANRPLLSEMTQVSNGFAISVSNADDIVGKIIQATSKLNHQALRNIKLKIDGIRVSDVTPEQINSLYRGEQLIIFGHYHTSGKANITLSGKVGDETRKYKTQVDFPEISTLHPELERLWAYGFIQYLQSKMDYLGADKDSKQAITDIAKSHGLVTDYTSMLVVRDEVFQQLNIDRSNDQRINNEQKARETRAQQPTQSTRVDQQQPMFNKPRSTLSGGGGSGSFDLWMLLMLSFLSISAVVKSKQSQ